MEKMNEQTNLFDSDIDKRYQLYGHYCNDGQSTKTAVVNGVSDIVTSFSIELTKVELKRVCRDAIKIVRFKYGYSIKFLKNNVKKELLIRSDNYTTSKK